MTLLELLVELDGYELARDGAYIHVEAPAYVDPWSEEWAPIREAFWEHKQELLSLLPPVGPGAITPKVHGPGGNVVVLSDDTPS
jgi:hypothetical protein